MAAPLVLSEIRGLREALTKVLPKVSFDFATPNTANEATLSRAKVIIADPPSFAKLAPRAKSLRWCQSTYAGVNALVQPNGAPYPKYTCTRLAGVMGDQMAEYCAQHILNVERDHARVTEAQRNSSWLESAWNATARRPLKSLTLGILGAGDLGSAIATSLKTGFGMHTIGIRRKPNTKSRGFDELLSPTKLSLLLARADYVVNVLPSTSATRGLLGNDVLRSCKGSINDSEVVEIEACNVSTGQSSKNRGTVFINVGRGDVLSEADILRALDFGWLNHAVLDVFDMEPLPSDSLLWRNPKVTITPHVSSLSMPSDVATLFASNWRRWEASNGDPTQLEHVVDWAVGY